MDGGGGGGGGSVGVRDGGGGGGGGGCAAAAAAANESRAVYGALPRGRRLFHCCCCVAASSAWWIDERGVLWGDVSSGCCILPVVAAADVLPQTRRKVGVDIPGNPSFIDGDGGDKGQNSSRVGTACRRDSSSRARSGVIAVSSSTRKSLERDCSLVGLALCL